MQTDWAMLVGRIILVLLFLIGGIGWATGKLDGAITAAASVGVPMANILVPIAMVVQIVGALMVIAGFHARLGALGLLVFTFVTLMFFHRFWEKTGQPASADQVTFFKDLALCGGLLYIVAAGAGRLSIDARRTRA
jgi:putative oxidoreductase